MAFRCCLQLKPISLRNCDTLDEGPKCWAQFFLHFAGRSAALPATFLNHEEIKLKHKVELHFVPSD
jgi:hypothetical protein